LSRSEQALQHASEHPVRFTFGLLLLLLASIILGALLPSDWYLPVYEFWQPGEQLSYFSTLWAVQATLAALVYPIAIAFVAVFLQRRPTAETFVHLYILDSGALAAGLSALALVLAMAVQYVLLPTYGARALATWTMLDSIWFAANAALTMYFLYRTVEFLRPEVQIRVMQKYAVGVALPRDVLRLNSFQVLARAQSEGWILAPDYLNEPSPEGPSVLIGRPGFDLGQTQGEIGIEEPLRLTDVRLWAVRVVVAAWMRRAARWPVPTEAGRSTKWPRLMLPLTPGREYRSSTPLAGVNDGPSLSAWELALLRFAYVLRPVRSERYGIRVQAILEELESDARVATQRPNAEGFTKAYENVVEMHELLLGASLESSTDKSLGSWCLLPDISGWFDRPMHESWANTYRSIFESSLAAMTDRSEPIKRLCHLVQHLEGPEVNSSPLEVRQGILQLPTLLMYLLAEWWVQQLESQGQRPDGHKRKLLLHAPRQRLYAEVLSSFVSGWESARESIAPSLWSAEDFQWVDAPALVELAAMHVQETARLLLAAVGRGDLAAAEWFADVLDKWDGRQSLESHPFGLYDKTDFLTIEHVQLGWSKVVEVTGLATDGRGTFNETLQELQRGAALAALQNYWSDIRLLTVEHLLAWAEDDSSDNLDESLSLHIASGLLVGKQWHDGGNVSDSLRDFDAPRILSAKIRQLASGGSWRSGYVGRLNRFVERIKEMDQPDMVSSRIYSRTGADTVDSLQDQFLTVLAFFSDAPWNIGGNLRAQISAWLSSQYRSIDSLRNHLPRWSERLRTPVSELVLPELLLRTARSHDAEAGQVNALSGIESLEQLVVNQRDERLRAEPIDRGRLDEIARSASSKGFAKATGDFPLQLFGVVAHVPDDLNPFTLIRGGVPKGELTRVEMDQRAANDVEHWAESLRQRVGRLVLADVTRALQYQEVLADNPDAYWSALKDEAERIVSQGKHPLLLLSNPTQPEWVWEWQHAGIHSRHAKPDDLNVRRAEGMGPQYLCHFNQIAVYAGRWGASESILLAAETFGQLRFKTYGADSLVSVTTTPTAGDDLRVDLKIELSRDVELGSTDAVKLLHPTAQH